MGMASAKTKTKTKTMTKTKTKRKTKAKTKTKTKMLNLGNVREESGGRPALSSSCISTLVDKSDQL